MVTCRVAVRLCMFAVRLFMVTVRVSVRVFVVQGYG